MRTLAVTFLVLTGVAAGQDPSKFKRLEDAHAAVRAARDDARAELARKNLPLPDSLLAAHALRNDGTRAWRAKDWDAARAAFGKSIAAYRDHARHIETAQATLARLSALRAKRPPEVRLGFKQRKGIHYAHEWLARHQDSSGRWDIAGFMKHDAEDDRCDGAGDGRYDVGVTALALLAFVDAGYLDRDNHYALEVHRGLQWLRAQQDAEGVFGPREPFQFIYNHAIATLLLAKVFGATKDDRLRAPVERAVAYIVGVRQPGRGWRYDPSETDTSATTWCFRALAAASAGGIAVDLAPIRKDALAWVDSMTQPNGVIGYNLPTNLGRGEGKQAFDDDRSRSMTAAGTVLRVAAAGEDADRGQVLASLDRCLERSPAWNPGGDIDMYYWYYGSLAFRTDKKRANKWRTRLHKAVLPHQHRKRDARAGSWDPVGVWGAEGGRVYATAMLALTLLHAG